MSLLAWVFTPIFQVIFLGLAFFYSLTGDIGVAIILLTIVIRILLIPVFRAQIVSQRRMQMLQPELRAIQQKYKGDRARISAEQMQLYKERGVNPASGCLPSLLQLVLLLPMYQVFSQGLAAPDISSMLSPFGITVVNVTCQSTTDLSAPCINPDIPWLAWIPTLVGNGPIIPGYPGGLPANQPEIFVIVVFGFGLSLLALVSSLLQLVQTRMMTTPSDDPQQRTQQRMFLFLPLFSLLYGAILPAGLFIYWITTTIFSIVQQYLINGYGGLFPLFGWTPRFAVGHTPRFPVKMPERKVPASTTAGGPEKPTTRNTTDSAAGTIRPARRRSSRRGRRR
jgi:YidC/Oxa1 family membrane protein insertase